MSEQLPKSVCKSMQKVFQKILPVNMTCKVNNKAILTILKGKKVVDIFFLNYQKPILLVIEDIKMSREVVLKYQN